MSALLFAFVSSSFSLLCQCLKLSFTSPSPFSGSYLQALLTAVYQWVLDQSLGFPFGISAAPAVPDESSDVHQPWPLGKWADEYKTVWATPEDFLAPLPGGYKEHWWQGWVFHRLFVCGPTAVLCVRLRGKVGSGWVMFSPWIAHPYTWTGFSFPGSQHFSLIFSLIFCPFSMFGLCLTLIKPQASTWLCWVLWRRKN